MAIAITAPTGNIGRSLVPKLLAAGIELILVTRSPEKLDPEVRKRVTIRQGVLQDREFIRKATQGVEALYWLNPGNKAADDVLAWYRLYGESVQDAVACNEIPYVVNISAIDPDIETAGVASGIGLVERYLNTTEANVIQLRPGFFLENLVPQLKQIRDSGTISFPIPPEREVDLIATEDIAVVAAEYLQNLTWKGKIVRNLYGAADLTFPEAARRLTEATGRPIRYVGITLEEFHAQLVQHGVSVPAADGYVQLYARYHLPGTTATDRTPESTTPTTVDQWGRLVLKPLLEAHA
jgi:uncharacterized protein YbjT (DUF2867 family)